MNDSIEEIQVCRQSRKYPLVDSAVFERDSTDVPLVHLDAQWVLWIPGHYAIDDIFEWWSDCESVCLDNDLYDIVVRKADSPRAILNSLWFVI